ncbi:MAG: hypothetical protein ACPGVN_02615 [Alphaproteobacteria bacterium]
MIWVLIQAHTGFAELFANLYNHIPGISSTMITEAGESLRTEGGIALFLGALKGTPYKLYALAAGIQHWPFLLFVGVSIVSRFARFSGTCALTWLLSKTILRRLSLRAKLSLHTVFWILFYAIYFWII